MKRPRSALPEGQLGRNPHLSSFVPRNTSPRSCRFSTAVNTTCSFGSAPRAQAVCIFEVKIVKQGKSPQYLNFLVNWRKCMLDVKISPTTVRPYDDRLLTLKELAAYLSVNERTLLKLVSEGDVPA